MASACRASAVPSRLGEYRDYHTAGRPLPAEGQEKHLQSFWGPRVTLAWPSTPGLHPILAPRSQATGFSLPRRSKLSPPPLPPPPIIRSFRVAVSLRSDARSPFGLSTRSERSDSRKHIDFSLFCPQTGPDKVVRTVGEVYTIT